MWPGCRLSLAFFSLLLSPCIFTDEHEPILHAESGGARYPAEEETQTFWKEDAQNRLIEELTVTPIIKQAKNVIIFLGDGMGVSTLTAARILKGQQAGMVGGEQAILSFEEFPNVALSRTYCVDSTVADSACSSTAYLGGVKGPLSTIGVTAAVKLKQCDGQLDPNNHVSSILQWAQEAGKATGVITTNRITDASPAGAYAHVAYRGWENDFEVFDDGADPFLCDDIAEQLIRKEPGKNFNVIMGGGRRQFSDQAVEDIEGEGYGYRTDGANLTGEWLEDKEARGASHEYLTSGQTLRDFTDYDTEFFMGLFSASHMEYSLERTPEMDDPTLAEMTNKALEILKAKENGFVAFIEAGRIDTGHHGNTARKALDETLQLDAAVTAALELVDLEETLIIVTADHSHAMTINGYPDRGHDIFGLGGLGQDDLYYSTLMYGTGPGYKEPDENGGRYDISQDDMEYAGYRFMAAAPKPSSGHSGEDVTVFAAGPQSHLFRGLYQQNYIPHVLAYAACIGDGLQYCDNLV